MLTGGFGGGPWRQTRSPPAPEAVHGDYGPGRADVPRKRVGRMRTGLPDVALREKTFLSNQGLIGSRLALRGAPE